MTVVGPSRCFRGSAKSQSQSAAKQTMRGPQSWSPTTRSDHDSDINGVANQPYHLNTLALFRRQPQAERV